MNSVQKPCRQNLAIRFASAHMKQGSETPKKHSLLERILFVLITLVVSGMGALSFFTSYAPARSTRFGIAGPLFGQVAQDFGLAIFVVGLLPLAIFARSAAQAGWFLAIIFVSFLAAVFLPLALR